LYKYSFVHTEIADSKLAEITGTEIADLKLAEITGTEIT
jgi:hypothetical protein